MRRRAAAGNYGRPTGPSLRIGAYVALAAVALVLIPVALSVVLLGVLSIVG